jgi:hypothetical protein
MNSLLSAIFENLSNGELAAHIAEALGDKKLKAKINKAIKSFFETDVIEKVEKKTPAKKTSAKKAVTKKTPAKKGEKKSYEKMTVAELKEELKAMKLDTKGKKAELIARLKGDEVSSDASEDEKPKKKEMKKVDKKKVKKEDSDSESEEAKVEYKKMKVGELRELLKERGLDSKGKKEELIERLEGADDNKDEEAGSEDEKDSDASNDSDPDEEGVDQIKTDEEDADSDSE